MRKIREVTLVYKKWTRHIDGCCQTPSQLKTTLCVLGRSARYCTDHSWRRQPWSWTAGSGMGRQGQGIGPRSARRRKAGDAPRFTGKSLASIGDVGGRPKQTTQGIGNPRLGGGTGLCGQPGCTLKGSELGRHRQRHP